MGNPRNARTHCKKQIRQIAASICEFGFTNPVLIDASGGIIAGHGRLEAAKKIGLEQIPTIRLDHFIEAKNALIFWPTISWLNWRVGIRKS